MTCWNGQNPVLRIVRFQIACSKSQNACSSLRSRAQISVRVLKSQYACSHLRTRAHISVRVLNLRTRAQTQNACSDLSTRAQVSERVLNLRTRYHISERVLKFEIACSHLSTRSPHLSTRTQIVNLSTRSDTILRTRFKSQHAFWTAF